MHSFLELYGIDFKLSEIVAINQFWQTQNTFSMKKSRPNNALILFSGCSGRFKPNGSACVYEIPRGSVFFVPEGSGYDWTFYDMEKERVSTVLFEFAMTDSCGNRIGKELEAEIIYMDTDAASMLYNKLICEFSRPRAVPVRIKTAAWELMTFVLESGRKNTVSESVRCIYKGIKYLEDDPKQIKTVKEIAEMCNVSTNYFERLFKQYAGCTPSEYRINKKMERAKLLLSVGEMNVRQISSELGFDDPSYFCRVFKKKFGITPTQMKNK